VFATCEEDEDDDVIAAADAADIGCVDAAAIPCYQMLSV